MRFQCVGEIEMRRSCSRFVCSRCEQIHLKAAWAFALGRMKVLVQRALRCEFNVSIRYPCPPVDCRATRYRYLSL